MGLCVILLIDLLFQYSFIVPFHFTSRSLGIIFSQSCPQIPCVMTLNSTSILDLTITACFLLLHVGKFSSRIVQYPKVDLWSTTDLVQFASLSASKLNSSFFFKSIPLYGVNFGYHRILYIACK